MWLADALPELLAEQHAQLLQRLAALQEAILTAVNGKCRGISSHKLRHFHDDKPLGFEQRHDAEPDSVASTSETDPCETETESMELPEKQPMKQQRSSFTPALFSSFEQFDLSLRRTAQRADTVHRRRKLLGLVFPFGSNGPGFVAPSSQPQVRDHQKR